MHMENLFLQTEFRPDLLCQSPTERPEMPQKMAETCGILEGTGRANENCGNDDNPSTGPDFTVSKAPPDSQLRVTPAAFDQSSPVIYHDSALPSPLHPEPQESSHQSAPQLQAQSITRRSNGSYFRLHNNGNESPAHRGLAPVGISLPCSTSQTRHLPCGSFIPCEWKPWSLADVFVLWLYFKLLFSGPVSFPSFPASSLPLLGLPTLPL
ncbi:PREDICTED: uncharacterized protein LOC105594857 [Cercocebus atys]|uniref:uncharacterized protein LOC105594857 n=1 Tax=Cercocebus atys TaxID=9531 RepID=UPI0005F3A3FF|nr:PREDICTED: uncharacterized protein LOC105594857 [Cercocebus atys]